MIAGGTYESESTPLHGMRIQLYEDEEYARAAAAESLARHPEKDARGRAVPLAPPVAQYAKKGLQPAGMTLRAVSATDAGMCGGNTTLARQYWDKLERTGTGWKRPGQAREEVNTAAASWRAALNAVAGAPGAARAPAATAAGDMRPAAGRVARTLAPGAAPAATTATAAVQPPTLPPPTNAWSEEAPEWCVRPRDMAIYIIRDHISSISWFISLKHSCGSVVRQMISALDDHFHIIC